MLNVDVYYKKYKYLLNFGFKNKFKGFIKPHSQISTNLLIKSLHPYIKSAFDLVL